MGRTTFFWKRRKAVSVSSEERVFTDYVRTLSEGREPGPDLVQSLEEALRRALVTEMKRRGLWESPPSWLGVFGWERWEPRGSGPGGEGALEELLAECYAFIFVSRLRSLEAQLRIKPNIDGLVFLNIRHFLHERQKTHDPLGSQVFEVLQSAVRDAVESGKLRVVEGDERIRNDTVLAFGKEETGPGAAPALRETVAAWNDELLPDLVTLRGRRQEEIVRRLRDRLADLRTKGIESFRFKDLVDPMKADVRARWGAALELAGGEVAEEHESKESRGVPLVFPDTGIEERQLFRWLVACVLDRIERLDVNDKTRRYLLTLWNFLRIRAAGAPVAGLDLGEEEESPSLRKISDLLHIPRERLPVLYKILGSLLNDCRDASTAWNTAAAFRPGEVRT
ncbi:MAG TPA: hypothetical protein VE685_07825 [Thermoanaerobaculia bacterium]|nr:hypothetical protein [Thermoanaerobaculia bacterium]